MEIYLDRFDLDYLSRLVSLLDLENLIDTAYYEPSKPGRTPHSKKCISLEFCGLAANTLLGNDIGRVSLDHGVPELRARVSEAFKKIIKPETLKRLDSLNIYLRIKFCFNYIYSDFPACLIKAENTENWKYTGVGVFYDFHYSEKITQKELESSQIYASQMESLRKIYSIMVESPELIRKEDPYEMHQLQVRFSVIPSTLCILKINNIISTDSYIYSQMPDDFGSLSLTYPVTLINSNDIKQFESIHNHFNYLWRHDLTLYCGDATEFSLTNLTGIKTIRKPHEVKWQDKEARIRKDIMRQQGKNVKIDEKAIKKWEGGVRKKFALCTTKVELSQNGYNKAFSFFKSNLKLILLFIILTLGYFIGTILLRDLSMEQLLHWLVDHSLFSILLACVSIIAFQIEHVGKLFKKN